MRGPSGSGLPGAGLATALLLLLGVEAYLHTDAFLNRYRSVFAAGRAQAKLRYIESHPPALLILGNSRVDNALIPSVLEAGLPGMGPVFNLGMPGSDARALYGMLARLGEADLLGPGRIGKVVIGLDEDLIHHGIALGYEVFFADRRAMWEEGQYADLMASTLRLWGFNQNIKELREPGKFAAFLQASRGEVEPVGGSMQESRGYRPGIGTMREDLKVPAHKPGANRAPDPAALHLFRRSLDLLQARKVETVIVFPPFLDHKLLYFDEADTAAPPYREVVRELAGRGIPMIDLDPGEARDSAEFTDPTHLNHKGATRVSGVLAARLGRIWPGTLAGAGGKP